MKLQSHGSYRGIEAPLTCFLGVIAACSPIALSKTNAQTVGPEHAIRDNALSGSSLNQTALFTPEAAFLTWQDTRSEGSSGGDIYAQKVGPDGVPQWTANGEGVCTAPGRQSLPTLCSDGAGGIVVTWLDAGTNPDTISAQRISSNGAAVWTANGVPVGVVYMEEPRPFVHRSLASGFLITWWDSSPNLSIDSQPLLAQMLSPAGVQLWDPAAPDGEDLWGPGIAPLDGILRGRSVPDGQGGVIVLGKIAGGGFRFQRIALDQTEVWSEPVDFAASLADTIAFNFDSDGDGGVVVAYQSNSAIRALKVDGSGTLNWGAAGLDVVTSNVVAFHPPVVAGDGQGGAFVSWVADSPRDIRVQHFSAAGAPLWPAEGAIVPDGTTTERNVAFVSDQAGGLFLGFATSSSLRGQRLNAVGAPQWFTGASNGLNLGSGSDNPMVGATTLGPLVFYTRLPGLFVRAIELPQPLLLSLTNVSDLPNPTTTLHLSGGSPGLVYEVHRAQSGNAAWAKVGTIQSENVWVDTNPPVSAAFYLVRDPTP